MHHSRQIFPEVRMPCVQTDSNLTRVHGAQNLQKVSCSAGEQIWKHVFQHETDTQPATM